MTMLTAGVILLVAGAVVAVLVPRGREVGLIAALVGAVLIVAHYLAL